MRWPSRRSILRQIIGPRRLGALYNFWRPSRRLTWAGPFNGQMRRCLLFAALVERLQPAAIVETGTYLGTTTEWMAAFQLPVFTCESSEENFGFAQARLCPLQNVTVALGDCREYLRGLLTDPAVDARRQAIIFYLDAHWNDDLPLAEEVNTIFSLCPRAVILIDDFEVPGDAGYGFDDYGPSLTLNASYIAPAVREHGLAVYYPSTPSSVETGMRRGSVVLCKDAVLREHLCAIALLRHAQSAASSAAVDHRLRETHGGPSAA